MAQYPQQPLTLFCGGGNLAEFSTAIISFWKEVKSQSQLPSDMNLPPHSLTPNLSAPQLQTHWSSPKTVHNWLQNVEILSNIKIYNCSEFWSNCRGAKYAAGPQAWIESRGFPVFQPRENTFNNLGKRFVQFQQIHRVRIWNKYSCR